MSLEAIHLRKLIAILYSSDSEQRTALRSDIRHELRKLQGAGKGGGDFHTPFWTDAKNHAAGIANLGEQSKFRIEQNWRRKRLYPQLTNGFLSWWNEKRRWRNEPFEILSNSPKAQFEVPELDAVVKLENLLAFRIGDKENRIVYPYFSEVPILPDEGARLCIWLLGEALEDYKIEDMRILDVLRGKSFATIDVPLQGNEQELFIQKYDQVLKEWDKLRKEYD